MDPLLNEQAWGNRFLIKPIHYPDMWDMYKKAVASFWTVEEVDLSHDLVDFQTMTELEQTFIKKVLAFFAASDAIVAENLSTNFAEEVKVQEARCFYGFQIAMENTHSEMYAELIENLVRDASEKQSLLAAVQTDASIKAKADWALKWMNPDKPFAQRLVAFCVVEGVFFSSSFAAIFWLKKRGLMHGVTFSNELISRDEGMHTDFGCLVYSHLQQKCHNDDVTDLVHEAVECECAFVKSALPHNLLGINNDQMQQYVRFVADRLLLALGHEKVYGSANPFDWMELISLQGKTNFFEKRVGEYQKAGVMADKANQVFTVDAEF